MISKEAKEGMQMAAILAIPGGIALMVCGVLFSGWVLSVMWGWFLVPLGVPSIAVAQAIGISLTVSLLTKQWRPSEDDKGPKSAMTKLAAEAIARPFLALLFGWVITLFM